MGVKRTKTSFILSLSKDLLPPVIPAQTTTRLQPVIPTKTNPLPLVIPAKHVPDPDRGAGIQKRRTRTIPSLPTPTKKTPTTTPNQTPTPNKTATTNP